MPLTLCSTPSQEVGHVPPVPDSPSHLCTWFFDAKTSDDSNSVSCCLNPPSTISTISTKPGAKSECVIYSDCELECGTPTPIRRAPLGQVTTEPGTESQSELGALNLLLLTTLCQDPPNTPHPETQISDLKPEPANSEMGQQPLCTQVDFTLCHKIHALKHYAHWPYHQIAAVTGVALSTVCRIAHPALTPTRNLIRGCHSILRTLQREKLITLATFSADNCRKS